MICASRQWCLYLIWLWFSAVYFLLFVDQLVFFIFAIDFRFATRLNTSGLLSWALNLCQLIHWYPWQLVNWYHLWFSWVFKRFSSQSLYNCQFCQLAGIDEEICRLLLKFHACNIFRFLTHFFKVSHNFTVANPLRLNFVDAKAFHAVLHRSVPEYVRPIID